MWVWFRMVLALVVLVTPGSFPLLLAYVAIRTLWARWRLAQAQAQANGAEVHLKDVLSQLHIQDLVREARAAF
jgi:hypothetical protein